jgi:drug/metabolite transporter (DMT)-like permease
MPNLNNRAISWAIFIVLSFIWGSSFVLMKLGLYDGNGNTLLSAYQVAALRLLSAGLVLLPFASKAWKQIPAGKRSVVILSGLLGSFFPAFLFCIAETQINSSLAGALNALTPVFVIITGFFLFGSKTSASKIVGVAIAFIGSVLLLLAGKTSTSENGWYAGYVIAATIFYGINVNMVRMKLNDVPSTAIATLAFTLLTMPSVIILWVTGFFKLPVGQFVYGKAITASIVLGVAGTAVASILFYVLVKRAGALFASMVTYGIPFVALLWGYIFNEYISLLEISCLCIILAGVYQTTK